MMDAVRMSIFASRSVPRPNDLCIDCGNFFNPFVGFESEGNECEGFEGLPCAGNPVESCGSFDGDFLNIYFKGDLCPNWPGNADLTSGSWRLIYFYKLSSNREFLSCEEIFIT